MKNRDFKINNLNVSQIREIIKNSTIDELKEIYLKLEKDDRKSVKQISTQISKKIENYENEIKRIESLYEIHDFIKEKYNAKIIIFLDEVGRGPLAGPVTAAGVILKENPYIFHVNDSKKITHKKRLEIINEINKKNIFYNCQSLNSKKIDNLNILQATLQAMRKVILTSEKILNNKIDLVVIDGNQKIPNLPNKQITIEHGDSKVYGICLASIIAKEKRDNIMKKFDVIYPGYNFKQNKGYGTKEHIEAINRLGISPIHRMTFLSNI